MSKYPATVGHNLKWLKEDDRAEILFGIDCTTMHSTKPLRVKHSTYDKVVFNFPHLGNSVADQARNILQHQKLMINYFKAAKHMIKPDGSIFVTLFDSEPYFSWNVKALAKSEDLITVRSGPFSWDAYPGYRHSLTAKEGHTSKEQSARSARIYVFGAKDKVDAKAKHVHDSSDED
jgi:25S rRNA (uracil2634-N3)-methyltransferase